MEYTPHPALKGLKLFKFVITNISQYKISGTTSCFSTSLIIGGKRKVRRTSQADKVGGKCGRTFRRLDDDFAG